MAPDNGWGRG
ncbi:hypothetical protein YPPY98_4528, partial [Yersinia pestis PY-98]